MFTIEKLHHVGIPTVNFQKMQGFYARMLGLEAHPDKPNWLRAGDGFSVHLMPSETQPGQARIEQHFALLVDSLQDVVAHLLREGLMPFQATLDAKAIHYVTDEADPLDFGIGTVFLLDPENNTVEFLEKNKGIFAKIT